MINDFAELIGEVTERTGVSDVANRAGMHVGLAEEYIRKALHIGSVDLIADFDGLEQADSNWLLQDSPETYVQAVMYQVFQSKLDLERGGIVKALLDESLETIFYDAKLEASKGARVTLPEAAH